MKSQASYKISKAIKPILKDIARSLAESSGIDGILIAGSSARGEESYLREDGHKKLLSDIEMVIIVKKRNKEIYDNIKKQIEEISKKYKFYFFRCIPKLEYSLQKKINLRYVDKRFYFFELKSAGYQLWGREDYLGMIPNINISNLNYAELNTFIIHRFMNVINSFIENNEKVKRYYICRNMLDILTVLLCYEGYLVATYKGRMELFSKIKDRIAFFQGISMSEFFDVINFCYNIKIDPDKEEIKYKNNELIEYFLFYYGVLKKYIEEHNNGKCFIIDVRGIIRGIYYLSIKKIYKEILKPKQLEDLYHKMKDLVYNVGINNDIGYFQNNIKIIRNKYKQLIYDCS